MKRSILTLASVFLVAFSSNAQKVEFEEYDLNNGMHVILHQDNAAPVLLLHVLYHVGAKDEQPDRTEWLTFLSIYYLKELKILKEENGLKLFLLTEEMEMQHTMMTELIIMKYFLQINLDYGLWLESERLLHPIIEQEGVDTQNEVVKEEKRLRVDNQPYGRFLENVNKHMFKKHPYKGTTIGKMEHLDAAT